MGESKQKKSKSTVQAPSNIQEKMSSEKRSFNKPTFEMTYGWAQYKWMLIGLGFIALGLILMSGGWMPSPDVWDESIIYSSRRLVLAPICMIIGLGLQIYAIFKLD